QSRHRERNGPAGPSVETLLLRGSSDSTAFRRGSGCRSHLRRERQAPGTHPTSAQKSTHRLEAVHRCALRASAKAADLREDPFAHGNTPVGSKAVSSGSSQLRPALYAARHHGVRRVKVTVLSENGILSCMIFDVRL